MARVIRARVLGLLELRLLVLLVSATIAECSVYCGDMIINGL